jgi:hypothetical protein
LTPILPSPTALTKGEEPPPATLTPWPTNTEAATSTP